MFLESKVARILVAFIIFLALFAGFSLFKRIYQVNSYEDCVEAGNAIVETSPEQCMANGRVFINQN